MADKDIVWLFKEENRNLKTLFMQIRAANVDTRWSHGDGHANKPYQ